MIGEVWELDSEKGARVLYPAGSPEAAAWLAENKEPHDLEDPTPPADDEAQDAALPEPTVEQGPEVQTDAIEDEDGDPA